MTERTVKDINDIINIMGLFLLVLLIFFYFINPKILIITHNFISPITDIFISPIFFIKWIVIKSQTPALIHSFLVLTYTIFIVIFLNIYFFSLNAFKGVPAKNHYVSIKGFSELMEEHIYAKQNISFSLKFLENLNKNSHHNGAYVETKSYKEIVKLYLKKYGFAYYGFYVFAGFIFFPWVAWDTVNSTDLTILPCWLAILAFVYVQTKFIFELCVLIPVTLQLDKT
jgi:hypothetical protein